MANTFFTSDLHFRHKNILAYTDRYKLFCSDVDAVERFIKDREQYPNDGPTAADIECMNEGLVAAWNKDVGPDDLVIHTGDFCFGGFEEIRKWLRRLNGKKRFVLGNHDDRKHWGRIDPAEFGIERIYHGDGAQVTVNDRRIILSHFPYYIWDKFGHGTWNLCGHSHGSAPDAPKKQLDVGIDNKFRMTGKFELWSFDEVKALLDVKTNESRDHHTDKTNYS